MSRAALRAAFATMVAASAAPYGYTVSLWSTGAMLMVHRGTPRTDDVFTFAAGALSGYTVLGLLACRASSQGDQVDRPDDRVMMGVLHWFAVGAAIGAASLVAQIRGWSAWPLASFAATTLYVAVASAQLALVASRRSDRA